MLNNKHFQSILTIIKTLNYSRDTWEVFNDFLELAAICISNIVDLKHFDEREPQYLKTINKYQPEHQKLFPEMFTELLLALDYEYQKGGFVDVLGSLFHELALHNKFKGQFFTPQHICDMMGKILIGDHDKAIQELGYVHVMEPTCGSGAMVLGFAKAMRDVGYNHSQQMLVTAIDIDMKCVSMCYLQLSLYGIPAVVIHGDTLADKEWSRWYTPAYIFGGWGWRKRPVVENPQEPAKESQQKVIMPKQKEAMQTYEQLDLFSFMDEGE